MHTPRGRAEDHRQARPLPWGARIPSYAPLVNNDGKVSTEVTESSIEVEQGELLEDAGSSLTPDQELRLAALHHAMAISQRGLTIPDATTVVGTAGTFYAFLKGDDA